MPHCLRLYFLAPIMPEGVGSGKPREAPPVGVFPLSGMTFRAFSSSVASSFETRASRICRHCEERRDEAIQPCFVALDCFDSAEICYNVAMAKQRKTAAKGTKAGGFVVGRAGFAKISAVEGIQLTQVMEKRASKARQKGLTAEEYRRTIVRSYRKD
jgi:hypothetical protein